MPSSFGILLRRRGSNHSTRIARSSCVAPAKVREARHEPPIRPLEVDKGQLLYGLATVPLRGCAVSLAPACEVTCAAQFFVKGWFRGWLRGDTLAPHASGNLLLQRLNSALRRVASAATYFCISSGIEFSSLITVSSAMSASMNLLPLTRI